MMMKPDDQARLAAHRLWTGDGASAWFGMELIAVSSGHAVLTLAVGKQHCNGHGLCHGGVTFALADSAAAIAANGGSRSAVSLQNSITYLAPAELDDRLTAVAREAACTGRTGIYDVRIANQLDVPIAEFRGVLRIVPRQMV